MKKIVLIGSMRYPELFTLARAAYVQDGDVCIVPTDDDIDLRQLNPAWAGRPRPNAPVNEEKGHWSWAVDQADEVIVVRRPDGTLGSGTVDELAHAVSAGKPIIWA